ncbi:MAG: hypothetical protein ACFB16_11270 [Phormidesmis sp.]
MAQGRGKGSGEGGCAGDLDSAVGDGRCQSGDWADEWNCQGNWVSDRECDDVAAFTGLSI